MKTAAITTTALSHILRHSPHFHLAESFTMIYVSFFYEEQTQTPTDLQLVDLTEPPVSDTLQSFSHQYKFNCAR